MRYTFRPYHMLYFILFLILIWAWTTGWECSIFAADNCKSIQAFIRMTTFATFLAVVITIMLVSDYEKEITIPNPFKDKVDPEAEALYQEWLRERKDKP